MYTDRIHVAIIHDHCETHWHSRCAGNSASASMHSQPESIAVAQPRRLGLRPRCGVLTRQQPGGPGSAAGNAAQNLPADTSPDHLLLWGLRTYNSGTRRRPPTGISALMAAWQNSTTELSMMHIVTCAECGTCMLPSAHTELKQWSRQEVPPGSVPTSLYC
jgi:hypothetical protein